MFRFQERSFSPPGATWRNRRLALLWGWSWKRASSRALLSPGFFNEATETKSQRSMKPPRGAVMATCVRCFGPKQVTADQFRDQDTPTLVISAICVRDSGRLVLSHLPECGSCVATGGPERSYSRSNGWCCRSSRTIETPALEFLLLFLGNLEFWLAHDIGTEPMDHSLADQT
jgi:hypothetical protein